MNKKLIFFFLIYLLNVGCSFNNITGIWTGSESEKKRISEIEREQKSVLQRVKIYSTENIYNKDFNLLINLNRNYLYSSYKMEKDTLVEKISTRFYNKKENLIKFSNNNLELKRLKSIEKQHIKNIKLDKIIKL